MTRSELAAPTVLSPFGLSFPTPSRTDRLPGCLRSTGSICRSDQFQLGGVPGVVDVPALRQAGVHLLARDSAAVGRVPDGPAMERDI